MEPTCRPSSLRIIMETISVPPLDTLFLSANQSQFSMRPPKIALTKGSVVRVTGGIKLDKERTKRYRNKSKMVNL